MTLKEMPSIGNKIRYIGEKNFGFDYGDIYEISGMSFGDATFRDGKDNRRSIVNERFPFWELVEESDEAPRTESDLIANLALRVSDIERALAPKNYEDVGPANATPEDNEVDANTTRDERIEAVCNEVRDLLIRKNHDYGDSFSKQYAKYGVLSGLIRMDDKMARVDTLVNGEQAQVAESVEDTLLDLIGYATLTLVERRKGASE